MTGASQCFVLINHCSVFDLSFAKGAKKGEEEALRADEKKKQEKSVKKKRMGNKLQ